MVLWLSELNAERTKFSGFSLGRLHIGGGASAGGQIVNGGTHEGGHDLIGGT